MTTFQNPTGSGQTGATADTGATSDTGKTEAAKQTAGTAADEGKRVAGVAQGEAKNVAAEAKYQARGLFDDAKGQLDEQSRTQRDRITGTLRTLTDDLEDMAAKGHDGLAADLARQVADRARTFTSKIDGREPSELLDEVRDFARRKPGTFLLGALAAGVVAGRLTRGAKAARDNDTNIGGRTAGEFSATYPAASTRPTPTGVSASGFPSADVDAPATGAAAYPVETVGEPDYVVTDDPIITTDRPGGVQGS